MQADIKIGAISGSLNENSRNIRGVYTAPCRRIPGRMKIEKKDQGELIFFTKDESRPAQHVFVYRLTALCDQLREPDCESFYIAVPNGRAVTITDLPRGSYELEPLNH